MIKITKPYQLRSIRFVELCKVRGWDIKVYSISAKQSGVCQENIKLAKDALTYGLTLSNAYGLDTYYVATLIIHEGAEACYTVLNWWTGENMLQNLVFLKRPTESVFSLYSQNGMSSCVWELAVWWHERNAWIKYVLKKYEKPDLVGYLADQLNADL